MVFIPWAAHGICRFWMVDRCNRLEKDCRRYHPPQKQMVWDEMIARYEQHDHGALRCFIPWAEHGICRLWMMDRCNRHEKDCQWYHPPQKQMVWDDMTTRYKQQDQRASRSTIPWAEHGICRLWMMDHCNRLEKDCQWSHPPQKQMVWDDMTTRYEQQDHGASRCFIPWTEHGICRFWMMDRCNRHEKDCRLGHPLQREAMWDDMIARYEHQDQRASRCFVPHGICKFWMMGRCNRHDCQGGHPTKRQMLWDRIIAGGEQQDQRVSCYSSGGKLPALFVLPRDQRREATDAEE